MNENKNDSPKDTSQTSSPESGSQQSSDSSAAAQSAPDKNKTMGVLAYLGPLVIVSYLAANDEPFVNFHIKQGVVLLIIEVIVWFLSSMLLPLLMLLQLINLAVLVLIAIGIINVVRGRQKELPLVGQFSKHIPL